MVKKQGILFNNIRFYILSFSVLLSISVVSYLRIEIISDSLFSIRSQQVFGFISLAFWYLALLATPLSYVVGKKGFMKHYLFSRRALGVSAAYFAVLHAFFGIFGQLGGVDGLFNLPPRFQQVVLLGGFGLVVLVIMAITSFDRVISLLTFRRWKWIHRLSYLAIISVLLHIWIIGTHIELLIFKLVLFFLIILLVGLEAWRLSMIIEEKSETKNTSMRLVVFYSIFLIALLTLLYLPSVVSRYHESHGADHTKIGWLT